MVHGSRFTLGNFESVFASTVNREPGTLNHANVIEYVPGRSQGASVPARLRVINANSGGQKNRTGRLEVPAPLDV